MTPHLCPKKRTPSMVMAMATNVSSNHLVCSSRDREVENYWMSQGLQFRLVPAVATDYSNFHLPSSYWSNCSKHLLIQSSGPSPAFLALQLNSNLQLSPDPAAKYSNSDFTSSFGNSPYRLLWISSSLPTLASQASTALTFGSSSVTYISRNQDVDTDICSVYA